MKEQNNAQQSDKSADSNHNILDVKGIEAIISKICYCIWCLIIAIFIIVLREIDMLNSATIWYALISIAASVLFFIAVRRSIRKPLFLTSDAEKYLKSFTVLKKSTFCAAFIIIVAGTAIYILSGSDKLGIVITVFGLVLIAANLLKKALTSSIHIAEICNEDSCENYNRKKEITRSVIRWVIYWLIFAGIYAISIVMFGSYLFYLPILVLAGINFIIRLIVNNPFGKYSSIRGKRLTVKFCSYGILVFAVFYGFAMLDSGSPINYYYIRQLEYSDFSHNSEIFYNSEDGVYTVRATEDEFRILQLTDIHLCGSITTVVSDMNAITACYDTIAQAKPDLIIVTGDIVYPILAQAFTENNYIPFWHFCEFMDRIGIPWTFVYGNHDTEKNARYDSLSLQERLFAAYSYGVDTYVFGTDNIYCDQSLLYSEVKPEIYGRYNNFIRIEDKNGSLERLLFLIDSNDYAAGNFSYGKYDHVHADQIEWYEQTVNRISEEEGHTVKSFVFMHIPLRQFAEAQAELEQNGNAEYLFGENLESVSLTEYDEGFFEAIIRKGSTEAVFAGHDHLNNLGVKYKGVDLIYGKAIDYIAYPKIGKSKGHRGGILILLNGEEYSINQIIYNE